MAALVVWASPPQRTAAIAQLPASLDDREFWHLVTTFSERSGFFNSDNLVSNEDTFQDVIPELRRRVQPGTAYVGVGPDQNFTYIAALAPPIAFIVDIRRGNQYLHLLYKALFELASDRADFVSRLFSRPRPNGLTARSTPAELLDAIATVPPDRAFYLRNQTDVFEQLTGGNRFPLNDGDLAGIAYVYGSFFAAGPSLSFVSHGGGRTRYPSFRELQTASDQAGVAHAYLATEAGFERVKSLQERNLIVPVIGNFAGGRALPSVAEYLHAHEATLGAFYASNVEQYLFQDRMWEEFRANLERLPSDASSTIIRSCFSSCSSPGGPRAVMRIEPLHALLRDASEGLIQAYWDVLSQSRSPAAR
jgi:hypothetical protein